MKQLKFVFFLLLMVANQSYGQILETKEVYKLKSRQYTTVPDSITYKDSIDLNPFKNQDFINQVSVFLIGLEQRYRFDIKLTNTDTTAYVTIYTYEIKSTKPTRKEKKMFPNYKIVKKEEWKLKNKVTPLNDTIINSMLSIIRNVSFDSLPSYETMSKEIGLFQFDGHGFGFNIKQNDNSIYYSVNSLYLNKHKKLKELKPIESLLLDYILNRDDLEVEYLNNSCYNSGSIIWVCK